MWQLLSCIVCSLPPELTLLVQSECVPVGVLDESMQRVLAPQARLLVTTEGLVGRILVDFVQPHGTRLQARADALNGGQVGTPYGGSQTIPGIVGTLDDFLLVAPFEDRQDRTERLLRDHAGVLWWIVVESHRNEPTLRV